MGLYFFIIILFFISALADYSELAYWWQLKEYRLDRFRDFLGTVLGQRFLLSYKIIFRPLVFLLLIFSFPTATALGLVFAIDIFKSSLNFFRRRFNRPTITVKAVLIILASVILEAFIILSGAKFLTFSRFLIISLIVLIINLAGFFVKKVYYKKASAKLARYKNLTVIGVTGSYGKTTVKNFLEQMLGAKFKAVKTPKNINTELGISRFILKTDFKEKEFFIVEMAAYRVGEIEQICRIVKPTMGILTAINEQHLPLFGNLKNTQTAKYELLRALPEDGLAIANSDNDLVREFLGELKCQVKTFGRQKEFDPDCLITSVSAKNGGLEFSAERDNGTLVDNYEIKTNLIGEYNAMNIAPVLLTAEYLGMSKAEIAAQALKFELPEATMQTVKYGQSVVIDDSYNSNPEGFAAALKFLLSRKTDGKKIVVTRGMIELGEASEQAHERIGRLIAESADELVIISPDSVNALKRGADETKLKIKTIFNPRELLEFIKDNCEHNNLILLEGRMPDIIGKEIK